ADQVDRQAGLAQLPQQIDQPAAALHGAKLGLDEGGLAGIAGPGNGHYSAIGSPIFFAHTGGAVELVLHVGQPAAGATAVEVIVAWMLAERRDGRAALW